MKYSRTAMAIMEEQVTDFESRNANHLDGAAPLGTLLDLGLEDCQFDTLALHAGAYPDPATGAMLMPIHQTTTYRQEAVGRDKET